MTEAGAPPHTDPSPDASPTEGRTSLVRKGRAALTGMLVATAVIVAVAVVAAVRDTPPTILGGAGEPTSAPAPTSVRAEGLAAGTCLTWDQTGEAGPATASRTTVPCDQPHLVEISGRVVITEDLGAEPTAATLDDVTDRLCRPVNEAHLGGPLDPAGRYYAADLRPSPEGWRAGEREVWCALGAHDGTEDPFRGDDRGDRGRHRPFVGPVAAARQFWVHDAGACLAAGRRAPVDCAAEHEVEVVGRIDLPDEPPPPDPDDSAAWAALVEEPCAARARDHLGRDPEPPQAVGWLTIGPASWAAGLRTVECVVGQRAETGDWITVTGAT